MDDRLTRLAVTVNWRGLALGHDVFEAEGATFVRNTQLPLVYDANFVFGATVSEPNEIERLLLRATHEYAHALRVTFRVDPFTPPTFEASLVLRGYERSDALVLMLQGPLRVESAGVDVRRVENEAQWQAYQTLKCLDWGEHAARHREDPEDLSIPRALAAASRLKCPPVQYMLAYVDGQPVGHCNAWEGIDGIGQVEDLFVHPKYRRRGIATALLSACVSLARQRGAGPVVIVVDPSNTARELYAALGWGPIAVCRQYGEKIRGSG